MSPHLACYGYTMYGSQYNTVAFKLGKLFAETAALKPLRDLYFSAFDYRFASYGAFELVSAFICVSHTAARSQLPAQFRVVFACFILVITFRPSLDCSAGCRFDDKNLHTGIFFKAIAKHSPHAQQMLIRRANRAFDLMTKKEKAPYNVAGALRAQWGGR